MLPAEGEIHVWRIALDRGLAEEAHALAALPPVERDDLARFGRPELRRRALFARAAQRAILARYLGAAPRSLCFDKGTLGKPSLAVAHQDPRKPLHFNLSHSFERALLAVTCGAPVGIDVEHLRSVRQLEALAARYLAPAEQAWLLALPEVERSKPFLRLWVGKEAVAKATGEGLQFGLRRIALGLGEEAGRQDALRFDAIDDDPAAAADWTLEVLDETGDYVAAAAARRAGMVVRRWDFEPLEGGAASGR